MLVHVSRVQLFCFGGFGFCCFLLFFVVLGVSVGVEGLDAVAERVGKGLAEGGFSG